MYTVINVFTLLVILVTFLTLRKTNLLEKERKSTPLLQDTIEYVVFLLLYSSLDIPKRDSRNAVNAALITAISVKSLLIKAIRISIHQSFST